MPYQTSSRQTGRRLARRHLDETIAPFRHASHIRPPRGWIRAIRDALGMSARQLAERLGISQPSVTMLENSEELETITLRKLRAVAAAMDCKLVYAFVPDKPLEAMVEERARAVAKAELDHVNHTMALEQQAVGRSELAQTLDALVTEIIDGSRPGRIWDDVP